MNIEVQREQTVQTLCAHYAQDHLSTGELEARFERVNKAGSTDDLRTILEGLPALNSLVPAPAPFYSVGSAVTTTSGSGLAPYERRYSAVFAEVKKEGYWTPAPLIFAKSLFGTVLLDLRDAVLPADGIEIDLDVILGEAKIILPPGVGAEVDCSAFLGSVEDKAQRAAPGAPVVRVRGSTMLGSITVVTKLPKKERLESWRKQLRATFFGEP